MLPIHDWETSGNIHSSGLYLYIVTWDCSCWFMLYIFTLLFQRPQTHSSRMEKSFPSLPSLRVPKHLFRHWGCPLHAAAVGFSVCLAPRFSPPHCSREKISCKSDASQEGCTWGLALTPPLSAILRVVGALHAWSVLCGGTQAREGFWLCSAPCQHW